MGWKEKAIWVSYIFTKEDNLQLASTYPWKKVKRQKDGLNLSWRTLEAKLKQEGKKTETRSVQKETKKKEKKMGIRFSGDTARKI